MWLEYDWKATYNSGSYGSWSSSAGSESKSGRISKATGFISELRIKLVGVAVLSSYVTENNAQTPAKIVPVKCHTPYISWYIPNDELSSRSGSDDGTCGSIKFASWIFSRFESWLKTLSNCSWCFFFKISFSWKNLMIPLKMVFILI